MTINSKTGFSQANYIVRKPQPADIAGIRQVASLTWHATYSASVLEANRERVIAGSYSDTALYQSLNRLDLDSWFRVAESQPGEIVGFAEVTRRSGSAADAELTRIYVLPGWQQRGIGNALLDELLAALHSLSPGLRPPRLYLAVAKDNRQAISFYEKRGFQHYRDFELNLPGQVLEMQEYVLEVDSQQ